MKRIILTTTLVLGMMSSQSFGFDLLDRMLGMKGCGCATSCCEVEPACGCEAPACGECAAEPACGCEAPACGCEAPAYGCEAPACGCAEPACGCEAPLSGCAEPACGCGDVSSCDSGCGCFGKKHRGLLGKLFGCNRGCGCDSVPECGCEAPACGCAEPACGCEAPAYGCDASSCDSGCGCGNGKRHGGLLSKLFHCKKNGCDNGCDSGCDSGCGCGSATPVHAAPMMQAAPLSPQPMVDPSASLQSKRRVIQASARYVR